MDKKSFQPDDTLNVDVAVIPGKPGLSNEALHKITDMISIHAWRSRLLFGEVKKIEGLSQIDPWDFSSDRCSVNPKTYV